ncbi:MAG: acyl-CoA dehydrogenase family protein [Myxococcota bacterium]
MDFQLTDDQTALQSGVRSFCEGRVPVEQLPEIVNQGGVDRDRWGEVAELGVFALRLSEDDGGVGLGAADAVLVFAELGRRLVPGPMVWSHLAAGLIDGADTGEVVVGGLDLRCEQRSVILVEHLDALDTLMVLRDDGVYQIDPRTLKAESVAVPLDPLTPMHHVAQLPAGDRIGDAGDAARIWTDGGAIAAAQLLGIAEATLEMAADYALKREQFDRIIGGFQAVKHMLADMFVRQEVARAAVYAAGATIDDPVVGDVARAVSVAKLVAGDVAMKNSRACIQVHGGMGYTWEVPAHYYLKRTWVLESIFGTCEEHETRIADQITAGR